MQGLISYSGMAAKVRAMTGQLIKKEEYNEMAELRSVSEVAGYLSRYPAYRNLLDVGINGIHRSDMEDVFRYTVFRDFHRIYLFAGITQRAFLKVYYLQFENALLKRYLRNIFDGRTQESYEYREDISFFEKHSSLNIQRLAEARSVKAFREALKGSVFYPVLKGIEESGKISLFIYENEINLYFMKRMISEYKKILKKKDLEAITEIYGIEIDLLNLQWIYRARKHYRMESEEIISILIPIYYKISEDTIRKLIDGADVEDIRSLLRQSRYVRYAEEEPDTLSAEQLFRRIIGKIRSQYILKYPYSVACMENYLYRKEEEVDKLTMLLEGVRFKIGAQEIRNYLE